MKRNEEIIYKLRVYCDALNHSPFTHTHMPTSGRKPFRTTISTQNLTHFHVLEDSAEGNNSCAHLARVAEC